MTSATLATYLVGGDPRQIAVALLLVATLAWAAAAFGVLSLLTIWSQVQRLAG